MTGHTSRDRVDRVRHLDAMTFEQVAQIGQLALRLGLRQTARGKEQKGD
ncbi:MAG: hypothetical protein E6023_23285 [Pseudomonas aeruginosa]|nr:hypothetical protein [Pseudomonas aeruginosa]